jgi:hypothetical protein
VSIVRENYYAPLWTLLSAGNAFVTKSRKVRLLQDMEDGELPAIFMAVGDQPTTPSKNSPAKYRLGAKVFLYAKNPDQETSADMQLNALADALEAAIEPGPGTGSQILGRDDIELVAIEGKVEVFAAPNGTRAAAIVPIEIHVFG